MLNHEALKMHFLKARNILFSKRYSKEKAPKIQRDHFKRHTKRMIDWEQNFNSRKHLRLDLKNYVRVLDIVIEKRFLSQDNYAKCLEAILPFFALINFKRVINIEIDIKTRSYWHYLEERWGNSNDVMQFYNIIKLQGLLNKSNDQNKVELSQSIEKWFLYLLQLKNDLKYIKESSFTKNFDEKLDMKHLQLSFVPNIKPFYCSDKVFYVKLRKFDEKKINNRPCITLQKNHFQTKNEEDLNCFYYNNSFKELIGIKDCTLCGKLEGFEAFTCLYSKDWVSFYKKYIDFTVDWQTQYCKQNSDELYIKIDDSTKIKGTFSMYKQIYYESSKQFKFIHEIKFVFEQKTGRKSIKKKNHIYKSKYQSTPVSKNSQMYQKLIKKIIVKKQK